MEQQPEEFDLQGAIFVQLSRILDALYVIAGPEQGQKLSELHAAGRLLSPEPYLVEEEIE